MTSLRKRPEGIRPKVHWKSPSLPDGNFKAKLNLDSADFESCWTPCLQTSSEPTINFPKSNRNVSETPNELLHDCIYKQNFPLFWREIKNNSTFFF